MSPSLRVKFLLFAILISQAQGIRLNKGFLSYDDHKTEKGVVTSTSGNGADVEGVKLNGKTMATVTANLPTTSTASTTSKKDGNTPTSPKKIGFGGKDESLLVDSTLGPEHRNNIGEKYPDVIDLTGMDYSPAKRKPPIHN